ncbi:C39 family peptidase [Candidatus Uhrbacteria bacterium]|nr:C39 family peptidase [Candidatus Uhrbacteria bacterium]
MHRLVSSSQNAKARYAAGIITGLFLISLLCFSAGAHAAIIDTFPFTSQAPDGNWKNAMYQNGCEEASVIMAMRWVRGGTSLSKKEALSEIQKLSVYEKKRFGTYIDLSTGDTAKLIRDYYKHVNVEARFSIQLEDVINELKKGVVVLVPVDGRKLRNPYYTAPGPERHMLPIIGYDEVQKEFITNDPGTRQGKAYRYKEERLFQAIRDYSTGDHKPVTNIVKAMVVVRQ